MRIVYSLISIGAVTLALWALWRIRRLSEVYWRWVADEDVASEQRTDVFAPKIMANLFSAADIEFLENEAPREYVRRFSRNRAALAMGWVEQERHRMSDMFRSYRHTARLTPTTSASGELKVLGDFLLFYLTSALLYCLIGLRGPSHAAQLLQLSSDAADKVRGVLEETIPALSSPVEVIRPE